MTGRVVLAVTVLVGAVAAPAAAQVVTVPAHSALEARTAGPPPRVQQATVSLAEAVVLTLRHGPDVARAGARQRAAAGRLRQAGGPFDVALWSHPSLTVGHQQLAPFLRQLEIGKRATIGRIADEFSALADTLHQLIEDTPTDPPRCPSNLTFGLSGLDTTRLDETDRRLFGVDRPLPGAVVISLDGLPTAGRLTGLGAVRSLDLGDICSTPIEPFFSPDAFGGALRTIDQSGDLGLDGVLTSVAQIPREVRTLQEQIARTVAVRASLAFERLGDVPRDEIRRHVAADLGVSKLLRNGLAVDAVIEVQGQEHLFIDKPLDPSFGGLGLPTQFYSSASASLTVPLFQGRGRTATAADEAAALRMARAETEQARHSVSESVLRTVLAYLNLVAAQERLRLLDESRSRHDQILAVTRQRVAAGDVAGIEVTRVEARAASVASAAAEARAAVDDARVALAETVGTAAGTLGDAPLTSETFATTPTGVPPPAALIDYALLARRDARAAHARRDAAAILAEGARVGQRRRVDLTVTAGMSNLYDSPFFRYLPDETAAIVDDTQAPPIATLAGAPVPPPPAVRFSNPRGFHRALTGRYEPFVAVHLSWRLPFGNGAARGRFAQAAATLDAGTIEAHDLDRRIAHDVGAASEAVRRSVDAVYASEAAVQLDQDVLAGALRQLAAGDLTILDTLLTEQRVTEDQLRLVGRRQIQLSALARLRFDAGLLVFFDDAGTPAEQIRFDATDFIRR